MFFANKFKFFSNYRSQFGKPDVRQVTALCVFYADGILQLNCLK